MNGEIITGGLDFPEGPVWLDGAIWFTEITGGHVSRWTPDGGVERVADTGGGPNGATAAADGSLYVTQNGGMGKGGRATPGIQRVTIDGAVTTVATEVGGVRLDGPNDLAFGPDGRLWFTDPRGDSDPAKNSRPGRIFALDVASGEGELVVELGPVFPNGIAFLGDGTLVWSESFSRRIMRLVDGTPEVVIELPEKHFPDGFCVGADGTTLYVGTTYAHCVSVVQGGLIVDKLPCADGMITNCCFGSGSGTDLYVTDSRNGTLWRFGVGVGGLALHTGG
jgi:gluconolactonase